MHARRALVLSFFVLAFGAAAAHAQVVRVAALQPIDVRGWDARIASMVAQGTLKVLKVREDTLLPGRQHVRYEQRHRGVPVWGGDLVRQVAGPDTVSVFGTLYEGITLDTTPTVTREQATRTIEQLTGQTLGPSRQPELGILPRDDGSPVLGWRARVFMPGDVELIVLDARTGAVVLRRSDVHSQTGAAVGRGRGIFNDEKKMSVRQLTARFNADDVLRPPSLTTYDMHGSLGRVLSFLNGQILLDESDEATDPDNNWTDGPVVDAHVYAGYTYDYYFRRFNRRGLDGNDLPLQSLVHPVNREDIFGYPSNIVGLFFVNAFYAGGGVMVYGEGLPTGLTVGGATYTFFSGALDVVTHELSHGVTEYTSNLVYQNESGALNESFSDMMGAGAEFFFQQPGDGPLRADYLLGEDISSIPIRSMSNPASLGDPDHYSRRFLGREDNGGVHINSGIPNQVFFLAIEGGTNRTSGLSVQGVGASNRDQIEKVMYRGFTQMMPQSADFATARRVTIQAARDLFGAGGAPERAMTQAWTAVGVQ